ncbi:MAG: tol-pal system-associated acyl-CoA thioesterase [Rhodospirillaceae bacterium]
MSDSCLTNPAGRLDGATHHFPIRVYFEDTDAFGVVYNARYLGFLERARTEMMRLLGIPHAEMMADHGAVFAIRRYEIDYLSPARLDDLLDVRTRISEIGGATLTGKHEIWRGDTKLVHSKVRLGCISSAGKPMRIPAAFARRLAEWAGLD